MMRCWWWIVMLVACGPAVPPLPAQGGPPWLELTSDHFTVWTDASVDRARELVSEMEHLRQVIIGTSFRSVAREGRIFVIAVRDGAEFHAYYPESIGALASPPHGNLLHQAMIVLPAQSLNRASESDEHTEAHELTHAISYAMIPRQPRWFAEGLATFFQTIHIDDDHGTVDLGRAPERRGQPMRIHHLISVRSMFACKDCIDPGFYATAWAVFTYLQNVHADELARFEQLLAANEDPQTAWSKAFPRLPLDTLEEELRPWLVSGRHLVLHFNVQLKQFSVTQRVLADGDVHAARAVMSRAAVPLLREPSAGELAEIEAAIRTDPANVIANLMATSHDRPITPDAAKAIAAEHPDDWRAWLLVVMALRSGEEAAVAAGKACELAAANPAVVPPPRLCPQSPAGEQGSD